MTTESRNKIFNMLTTHYSSDDVYQDNVDGLNFKQNCMDILLVSNVPGVFIAGTITQGDAFIEGYLRLRNPAMIQYQHLPNPENPKDRQLSVSCQGYLQGSHSSALFQLTEYAAITVLRAPHKAYYEDWKSS